MVKLTAVSILKWNGEKEAYLLGIAADVSSFGYFQRSTVKEMLTFLSRTVAQRTQPGQRQSVQQEEYYAHIFNRDGLVGLAIVDKDYPARAAFGLVNKILDDFSETSQQRWRSLQADSPDAQPVVDAAIVKFQVLKPFSIRVYSPCCIQESAKSDASMSVTVCCLSQDPTQADKLSKIQKDLDETKVVLHQTIDSMLQRGEKLDSLVDKSSDLSMASQIFYKQAKKTNSCCRMM